MELTSQRSVRSWHPPRHRRSIFAAWLQRMNGRRQVRRNRAAMAGLSGHLLRDIGLDSIAREGTADFPRFGI